MSADLRLAALRAPRSLPAVRADQSATGPAALPAHLSPPVVRADLRPAALPALRSQPVVRADLRPGAPGPSRPTRSGMLAATRSSRCTDAWGGAARGPSQLEVRSMHSHHWSAEVPRFVRRPVLKLSFRWPAVRAVASPLAPHRIQGLRPLEQTPVRGDAWGARGGEGSKPSELEVQPTRTTVPVRRRGSEAALRTLSTHVA